MAKNFGPGIVGGVVLVDPTTGQPYKVTGGGGGGAVDSVNGQTGVVVLDAAAVNARPDDWEPGPTDINATGTASNATYLRGDGTWSTPPDSTPVDSVNGQTGVVVLDADDVLPTQTDQGGKVIGTDGTTASWIALPATPPTVATVVYTVESQARPSGADIVFWVPDTTALGNPTNAVAGDVVLRSVADAVQGLNGVTGVWQGTAAEYAAIGTPDPNVLYAVTD